MSTPGSTTGGFCTHCGEPLDPTAAFCGHCATPTGVSPDAAVPTVPNPVAPPSGPPSGPTGPPPGPGRVSPDAIAPPAGMPYVSPPAGPPTAVAASPATRRGATTGVLIGLGVFAVVLLIGAVVFVAVNRGSDDETADTVPPQTIPVSATVDAPALSGGRPVSVTLDPSTLDRPREHPLTLRANQTGTVTVTDGGFEPVVALVGPNGSEVPTEGVALNDGGAAVTVQARGAGEYSLLVSGFSSGQSGYDVEFRGGDPFVTPADVEVGDCVDALSGEQIESVSGFFVVDCAGPHRGQVFERIPGATESGQAAQERCDAARNERIPLAGRVNWVAYWGDGLTCVVVAGSTEPLTGSVVAG